MLGGYPLSRNEIGGVQTYIFNLAEILSDYEDIDLHIIVMGDQNRTRIHKRITIHTIKRINIPLSDTIWNVHPLIKKINKISPDIVHGHNAFPPYSLAMVAIRKRFPNVFTVHGLIETEKKFFWVKRRDVPKKIFYSFLEKLVYTNLKNITVPTPYVKQVVKHIITKDNHCFYSIPNGVDSIFFSINKKEQPDRILYIGMIERRKGILDLLKAITVVKSRRQNIKLHIVGKIISSTYYQQLIDYVRGNNLTTNISFTGPLSKEDIMSEYKEASIFISPSYHETFGIVLVEAMATGTPVIATSVTGIPYVVLDNKTGYLVNPGDIETLAEKILILLNDEDERRRIGQNGINHAKKFKWENIGRQIYTCYEEVIEAYKHEKR